MPSELKQPVDERTLCHKDDALDVLKEVIEQFFDEREGDLVPNPSESMLEYSATLHAKVTLLINS